MNIAFHFKNPFSHLTTKLLVSCPKSPKSSGGLYILDFRLNNISKIFDGDSRGITRTTDRFYIASNSHGILELDNELNIIKKHPVPDLDLHGLKVGPDNLIYAVETKHNRIGIYQANPFKRIDEIQISSSTTDENHINDIWIEYDRILVSMFSFKGGWRQKEGDHDGVIAEYSLKTKSFNQILCRNLQLPHSIVKLGPTVYFCESLAMNLRDKDNILAVFNGFARGLAYDGQNFYIGQSEMRHLDKILMKTTNVSLDCGIHVFDPVTKTNRFIHFPEDHVYEILVLDDAPSCALPLIIDLSDSSSNRFINSDQWYEPESIHRWTKTRTVQIKVVPDAVCRTVVMEVFNGYPDQYNAVVSINNKHNSQVSFNANELKIIELEVYEPGPLFLQIDVEKMWIPDGEYNNGDGRSVGLAIRSIKIS